MRFTLPFIINLLIMTIPLCKWPNRDSELNMGFLYLLRLQVSAMLFSSSRIFIFASLYTNAHFRLTNCQAFQQNYSIIRKCICTIRTLIFFLKHDGFQNFVYFETFFTKNKIQLNCFLFYFITHITHSKFAILVRLINWWNWVEKTIWWQKPFI